MPGAKSTKDLERQRAARTQQLQLEQLEQLRALQNGHAIQVALACEVNPAGVDTAEDLARVRALLAQPSR